MKIVFLGLSITSSWGNGHATTYRGLLRALHERGHEVLFLERDVPWYANSRDLRQPAYGRAQLYGSLEELRDTCAQDVARADLVIVGSYVPEGVSVGQWVLRTARGVTGFYDIDTPVTLAKLANCDFEYITPELAGRYGLYLSFTGGPTLERIRRLYGAAHPRALYCSVDPAIYYPESHPRRWDLGYLGTYSEDRQPVLQKLLLEPAAQVRHSRFVVAGPQYPDSLQWPENVERIDHLPPSEHRSFYNSQRFTLNVTRREMVRAGWSPSVRLFEAAACGVPIVSDYWPGLEAFFQPGRDIVVGETALAFQMTDAERDKMAARARANILAHHTAANRAEELEAHYDQVAPRKARVNGHDRAPALGPGAGRAAQPRGGRASGAARLPVGAAANRRRVQQSAGAGNGNGRAAEPSAAPLRSADGDGLRQLDGRENR